MKSSLLAIAIAAALTFLAFGQADACGWRCRGMVPVPTPQFTPPPVAVFPAPNPIPLPLPGLYAGPSKAYPLYAFSPAVNGRCAAGAGNCYWRRDCWYDAFGRRFCSW